MKRLGAAIALVFLLSVFVPGTARAYDPVPVNPTYSGYAGWFWDGLGGGYHSTGGNGGGGYISVGNSQGYLYSSPFTASSGSTVSVWLRCSDFCGSGKPEIGLLDLTVSQSTDLTYNTISLTSTWTNYSWSIPLAYSSGDILVLFVNTGGGGSWTDVSNWSVSNAYNVANSSGFNGAFDSNASGWTSLNGTGFLFNNTHGHTAVGAIAALGDTGWLMSAPVFSGSATAWSLWCNGGSNDVIWLSLANVTDGGGWDTTYNFSGVDCSAGWVQKNFTLTAGKEYIFRLRLNPNGTGTEYIDDICPAGGCGSLAPTPTPTIPAATATPNPWSGFPTFPPYPTFVFPTYPPQFTQVPYPTFPAFSTQVPYPTFAGFATPIYGAGTSVPVTFNGTPQPVFLTTPLVFPTPIPQFTAVPQFTQIPLATRIPTRSPTPTVTKLPFGATTIASRAGAFPTFSADPASHGGLHLSTTPNLRPILNLDIKQDNLDPLVLDLSKIGLPVMTWLVHVVYIHAFTLVGIDLQPGIDMLGATWMAVFFIRRLQKR